MLSYFFSVTPSLARIFSKLSIFLASSSEPSKLPRAFFASLSEISFKSNIALIVRLLFSSLAINLRPLEDVYKRQVLL